MTKTAFDREVADLCKLHGVPDMAPVFSPLYGMHDMLSTPGCLDSFVKAASRSFGDDDNRKKSVLRRLLPVVAALAAGGGLLAAGDAWGRYARDAGRTETPFVGIPRWIFEQATGTNVDWVGRKHVLPLDDYHRRVITPDEYDNLMLHGRYKE